MAKDNYYYKALYDYNKFDNPLDDASIDKKLGISTSKDKKIYKYTPSGDYSTIPKEKTKRNYDKNGNPYSDYYKSKRSYESRNGNVVSKYGYGYLGDTQYKDKKRYEDTGYIERGINWVDDAYDDVSDYLFGSSTPKTKKDKQEAKDDNNIEVHWGHKVTTKNKIFNEEDKNSLMSRVLNAEDSPDARELLYYARIDNKDGTVSYKLGTAKTSTFDRTKNDPSKNDITYLWTKRTDNAKELEALVHGNKYMLDKRRSDLGYDVENYGSGYTEIYNEDFLNMDGTVSSEKLRMLNESADLGLKEFNIEAKDRYDFTNLDLAEKELNKISRIFGKNSDEYKGLKYSLESKRQENRLQELGILGKAKDLGSAVASGSQQVVAGLSDVVLDALTYGNNTWLDSSKSAESADKNWGYKGRKEASLLGHEAVKDWDRGNYTEALLKGIQASPDTIAQSLPDMALMFSGGAGAIAKGASLTERAVAFTSLAENKGLTALAAKQTNNQIDERKANGEDNTNLAVIAGMFASNYALAGLDKLTFKSTVSKGVVDDVIKAIDFIPKNNIGAVAKKFAGIVGGSALAGVKESGQEYIQSLGEAINAGLGTKKFGNEFFNEAFTQQAKEGAILGFGAGGATHAVATTTGATIKAKNEIARTNNVKTDKVFSPTDDTPEPLKDVSNHNTNEELEKLLDTNGINTADKFKQNINATIDAITDDNAEAVSMLLGDLINIGIDKGYIDELESIGIYKTVYLKANPVVSTVDNITNGSNKLSVEANKESFFSSIVSLGSNLDDAISSIETAVNIGYLDSNKVNDFILSELNSNDDADVRESLSLIAESLGIDSTENNSFINNSAKEDSKVDKIAEEIAKKLPSNEDSIELDDLDEDVFGSIGKIFSEVSNGSNSNDSIQKVIAIVSKVSDKSKISNDVLLSKVADYISKITTIDVIKDRGSITDKLSGIENFNSIYNTVKAFKGLPKESIVAILKEQDKLIGYSNLSDEYSVNNTNKSTKNVMYDVVVGNGSYGKKSLSNYLHRLISSLAINDTTTRNNVVTKLRDDLAYWVSASHKEISTGVRADGVKIRTKFLTEQKKLEFDLKLSMLNVFDTVLDSLDTTTTNVSTTTGTNNNNNTVDVNSNKDINDVMNNVGKDTNIFSKNATTDEKIPIAKKTEHKLEEVSANRTDIESKLSDPIIDVNVNGLKGLKLPKVLSSISDKIHYKSFMNSVLDPIRNMFKEDIVTTEALVNSTPHIASVLVDGKLPTELINAIIFSTITALVGNKNGLEGTDSNYDILKSIGLDNDKKRITKNEYEAVRDKGLPRNVFVTSIARGIEKNLDVKSKEEEIVVTLPDGSTKTITVDKSKDFKKALSEELAITVVGNLITSNMLITSVANVKGLRIPFIKFKPNGMYKNIKGINELNKNIAEFNSIFKEDYEEDGYIASNADLPPVQKTTPNGNKIPSTRLEVMRIMRNTPYFVNTHLKGLKGLSPVQLMKLFNIDLKDVPVNVYETYGYSLDDIKKFYGMDVVATSSSSDFRRKLVELYVDNIKSKVLYSGLPELSYSGKISGKLKSLDGLYKAVRSNSTYFDVSIGSNGRFYQVGNGVPTPSSDKVIRGVLTTSNTEKVIDINNSDDLSLFITDVMYGMPDSLVADNYNGEDKHDIASNINEFHRVVKELDSNTKLKHIVHKLSPLLSSNNSTMSDEEIEYLAKYVDMSSSSGISALVNTYNYINAVNSGSTTFVSSMLGSSDAKNQAVAFKSSTYGTLDESASVMLSTGIVTETGLNSIGVQNKETFDVEKYVDNGGKLTDAYQEITLKLLSKLSKSNPKLLNLLNAIYGELADSNGKVTSTGRNFSKYPLMTHLYGMMAKSLQGMIGSEVVGKVQEQLFDLIKLNKNPKNTANHLRGLLNEAIDEAVNLLPANDKSRVDISKLSIDKKSIDVFLDNLHTDKENTEFIEALEKAVGTLLGNTMFESLDETFKPFKVHNEAVVSAYEASFVLVESIKNTMYILNNMKVGQSIDFDRFVNKYVSGKYGYRVGDSKQEITIAKEEIDTTSYDDGTSDKSLLDGGNKIKIKVGNKSFTYRSPKYKNKSASASILPVTTHVKDSKVIEGVIKYLRINQVYDALMANGKLRVASELIGNLVFFEEAFKNDTEIDNAITNLEKLKVLFDNDESTSESTIKLLTKEVKSIAKTSRVEIDNINDVYSIVDGRLEELYELKKAQKANVDAKIKDLVYLSQFGVNGKVHFKDGNIVGFSYKVGNGVKVLSTVGGKKISSMSIEDMKKAIVHHFLNGNDKRHSNKGMKVKITNSINSVTSVTKKVALNNLLKNLENMSYSDAIEHYNIIMYSNKVGNATYDINNSLDVETNIDNLTKLKESTVNDTDVISTFNRIFSISGNPEEKGFLLNTLNSIIMPIMSKNGLSVELTEYSSDSNFSVGYAKTSNSSNVSGVSIAHGTEVLDSSQSSSEVYVHELVHTVTKNLFGSKRLKNTHTKELSAIRSIYEHVKSKINDNNYKEYFGDTPLAKAQYEYAIKSNNMSEFVSYALSNKHLHDKLSNMYMSNDTVKAKSLYEIVSSYIIKFIDYLIHGSSKSKNLSEQLNNIVLEANGINVKYNNIVYRTISKSIDKLKTFEYRLKHNNKTISGIRYISEHVNTDKLSNIKLESNLKILLEDLLPSSSKLNEYVKHKIKAMTSISKSRDTAIKIITKKVTTDSKGDTIDVTSSVDEELKKIIIDYDLASLLSVGIEPDEALLLLKNRGLIADKIRYLSTKFDDLYGNTANDLALLDGLSTDIANGLSNRKFGTNHSYSNLNSYSASSYFHGVKTKYHNEATIGKLSVLLDAISTLKFIDMNYSNISSSIATIDNNMEFYSNAYKIYNEVSKRHFKNSSSNEKLLSVKGYTKPLVNSSKRIVGILSSDMKDVPINYTLIDSIPLNNGSIDYYLVETSVLKSRIQGSVGIIDYNSIFLNSSILAGKNSKKRESVINNISGSDVNNKHELLQHKYTKNGAISDIFIKVPEHLENRYLDIDNRVTATIGDLEGRRVEFEQSNTENAKWLDIANKDFKDNFSKNRKDFVWVGLDSKIDEYVTHYKVLPEYLKYNISKTAMSMGGNGAWLRKSTLRLTMGGDGKSITDALHKFGITSSKLDRIVNKIEYGLRKITKEWKLEVVGKTYEVIVGNFVSNVLLETIKGRNPFEVIKLTLYGMRELYKLETIKNSILDLELSLENASANKSISIYTKIGRLKRIMKDSPVYYLDEAGFNSTFVEDVTDYDSSYKTKLEKSIEDKSTSSTMAKYTKSVFDTIYMTSNTKAYKVFNTIVSSSDFASRYATDVLDVKYMDKDIRLEFNEYIKKFDNYDGYSKEDKEFLYSSFYKDKVKEFDTDRNRYLLEQHIDYSLKSGDILTYADNIGLSPFFKFKQRIGKVLYRRYKNNPLVAGIIGSLLYLYDGNLLGDYERAEESFTDILSDASGNPLTHIGDLLTPPMLESLGLL